ncbi:hypothetical protein A2U01_0089461, partial [Trifolium medium]|nr:hypothetical protein [Trifolium medium]
SSGPLRFDPEIERTARANRKAVKLAKEVVRLARLEQETLEEASSYDSKEEHIEMAKANPPPPPPPPPRRTLGDYGKRNNGEI